MVAHCDLGPLGHVAVLIGIAVDGLDSHVVLKLIRRGRELDIMPEGELSQPDENICEVVLNTSAEGFANVQTAIANRPNRLTVVQCLTCPVLAIAGSKDQILPVDVALEPAKKAQHGRTVSLPGVGHLPMVEVPFTLGALLVSM